VRSQHSKIVCHKVKFLSSTVLPKVQDEYLQQLRQFADTTEGIEVDPAAADLRGCPLQMRKLYALKMCCHTHPIDLHFL
jgi:hypothetical protein